VRALLPTTRIRERDTVGTSTPNRSSTSSGQLVLDDSKEAAEETEKPSTADFTSEEASSEIAASDDESPNENQSVNPAQGHMIER
jgi:hypothetical protein